MSGHEEGPVRLSLGHPGHADLDTAEELRSFGQALAVLLRAGDLLILSGPLGAGKTTLAQGIGAGLGVRGPITSPTFVIAREHPSLGAGPALVHVDAYRLASLAELDDMDLDAGMDAAVTLVEWGDGMAEDLAESHLHIALAVDPATERRTLRVRGIGARWATPAVRAALDALTAEEA